MFCPGTARITNGICIAMEYHKCVPDESHYEECQVREAMRKEARNVRASNRMIYDDHIANASPPVQSKLTYKNCRQVIKRAREDNYPEKFGSYSDMIAALRNTDLPDISDYFHSSFKYEVKGE